MPAQSRSAPTSILPSWCQGVLRFTFACPFKRLTPISEDASREAETDNKTLRERLQQCESRILTLEAENKELVLSNNHLRRQTKESGYPSVMALWTRNDRLQDQVSALQVELARQSRPSNNLYLPPIPAMSPFKFSETDLPPDVVSGPDHVPRMDQAA